MQFLVIGDVHLADRGPRSRTPEYRQQIEDKIRWCVDLANDVRVDAIIQLGDFFHIKSPNRNSHGMVQEAAKILGQSKAPVILTVGNHDIRNDSLTTLKDQPLGTLGLHPNVEVLIGPHREFPLFGQPYFDLSSENLLQKQSEYEEVGGSNEYPILLAHNSIFPEKEIPPYNSISAEDWSEIFKAEYTLYGHIHEPMDMGWHYKLGRTHFLNNGSISRGSLAERNLVRKPQVTLFDTSNEKDPFTTVEVPHLPAAEVFFLREALEDKAQTASVEQFLSSLGDAKIRFLTTEAIVEDARTRSNLSPQALQELEDILENVS